MSRNIPRILVAAQASSPILILQLRSIAVPLPSVKISWMSDVDDGADRYTINRASSTNEIQ